MRTNGEIVKDIQRILDESILPHVQSHGGFVSLQKYEDGVVTMFLTGACAGCAMSSATLKMGIENMLKHYIPEVHAVEGVEDPNSTVDPYYK